METDDAIMNYIGFDDPIDDHDQFLLDCARDDYWDAVMRHFDKMWEENK